MNKKTELVKFLEKNGWLLIALLAGMLLLSLGSDKGGKNAESAFTSEEQRLSLALSKMEGVGRVTVLLSEKPGRDRGYSGAVVVCTGGGDPAVVLRVTLAVRAFTDLGSDKIIVQKMIS